MRTIIYLIFFLFPFTLQASAQVKKDRKKPLPVKVVVTIKEDKLPEIKFPSEESDEIWNVYVSRKHNFSISFPAKAEDVRLDEMDKFVTFETNTQKAVYRLMIKSLSVNLSNSQLDEVYEASFSDVLVGGNVKLISKKNVYLNRKLGREFVFEDKKKVYFQRIYILEGRLYFVSVTLPKKQYTKDFDKWTLKFFESFAVEAKDIFVG
jgi:hypothetical protein